MANLIFYNGKIYTMAGEETVSAVAVKDGLIEAVGNDVDILSLAEENCGKIDLKGACMVPGFNDSHCHLLLTGLGYERLELRNVRSLDEIVEKGRRYIAEKRIPAGTWIVGGGYDHNVFADPKLLDGALLDRISTEHPIMIERVCGHVGAANTLAMKLADFDKNTKMPGGNVELDEEGNPTGVLWESALDAFKRRIPAPETAECRRAIMAAAGAANSFGITSVQTDDLEGAPLDTVMEAYSQLEQEGTLTLRINEEVQSPRPPVLREFLKRGLRTGDGTDFLRIGNIKLITDGSLGARSAYMREDYADAPGNRGIAVYTQEELDEVVSIAHKAGMQVACHAIGDGAVEQCVHAFRKAYEEEPKELRHRIVHCQFGDKKLFDMMAEYHIAADIQPPFTASDMSLTAPRLGERENLGYCWKTMHDTGILLGGGSDSPVETMNPLWGIYCAVTRTDEDGNPAGGWHPGEKLSVWEAVSIYTKGGAALSLEENKKGMIREGFLADFAVLSDDIFELEPERIKDVTVERTVVGGKTVYLRVR